VLRERYLLQQVIGSGGTSMVYRAQDLRHDTGASSMRVIAVKLLREELRDDARAIERLKREFTQMQLLAHPAVLKVFDLDVDRGVWFMTMEMLEGQSLSMYLRTHRAPHPQALELIRSCAEALQFAHERGIVHGDLKPGNIFLTGTGVRVLDFIGAADEFRCDRAATPAYASPQRLAGELPEVSDDIFSLGCVAYEMLTGLHPFDRKPASVAHELGLQPARINSLTYRQWRALDRALAFDRRDRHESMRAFMEGLFHDGAKAAAGVQTDSDSGAASASPREAVPSAGIIPVAMPAAALTLPPTDAGQAPAAQSETPGNDASIGLRQREVLIEPLADIEPRKPAPLPPVFEPQRRGAMLPVIIALLLAAVGLYLTRSDLDPNASTDLNVASSVAPATSGSATPADESISAASDTADTAAVTEETSPETPPAAAPAVIERTSMTTTKPPTSKGSSVAKPANAVGFVTSRVSVSERSVAAVLQVKRLGDSARGRVPVRWRTEKRSARPGEDYVEVSSGTLILQDGQRIGAIYVPIINDDVSESDEMFVVELLDTSAAATPDIGLAIVTIRDDDRPLLAFTQ
jgi:serine/threonine protein kinase